MSKRIKYQAATVVLLGAMALFTKPRAAQAAPVANATCIGGCCICVENTTCGDTFGIWDACIAACGVPPATCDDSDIWDCPGGAEVDCE